MKLHGLGRLLALVSVVGLTGGFPQGVNATTYFEEEFECPIGGEKFKARVAGSTSTFGSRADGKAYGGLSVWPIPECPENGLPLFEDEFDEAELEKLRMAIETSEFQSMRQTDTSRFRLFWLKRAIGRSIQEQLGALLQATWQTDGDWPRKNRYQAKFVEVATSWEWPEEAEDRTRENWFWMNMRSVNALRELGYYPEGLRHLRFVMEDSHLPGDVEALENAKFYATQLERLLSEENPHPEPTNLTPVDVAIFRCVTGDKLTDVELEFCATERFVSAIEEYRFKPKKGKKLSGRAAILAAHDEYLQSR